jgi:catechol 2,3-dioxygenase-like lactoylglutathione lyase family enzyme
VLNDAEQKRRVGSPLRMPGGPSQVMRLGHCVLNVTDFRKSEAWYKARFGLVTSDEIELAPDMPLGAFLRCDRGPIHVDHHTLFLVGTGKPGFNHAAFEVANMDDLMVGHEYLEKAGRQHEWGVGRHLLGSQIFDYWRDPWGHTVEHWTDGDLFNNETPPNKANLDALIANQWGPSAPPTMGN